ncbi:outer membrane beta-barrel family protein [Mucilaginibacter gotjawali]|uniref:Outer membrane receptor protein involved in Fe transport n=1 Tax=Mucilaginibacter gotjawali TaxID=1550579 RepID=A0A839SEN5_9SPHI|nr:outer membrane beta-barrel family protein [Mucilaginibacter gotjawali]MBB3056701.1 outer membrane receptor protein involved in Fe transport [Mucilaginibacter gotjawali]
MKNIYTKSIQLFLLLLLSAGFAMAQNNKPAAAISGQLLDENGKPMDFATVSLLKAQDSTVVKGTLSNENGAYTFDHINSGVYIIKASVIGYAKAISKVFTLTGNAANFTVPALKLQPASHSLNAVNITASKPLIEHKVDRTVMNVENSILAAGNSAMDILERAPGVSVDKDDNISLKGKQGVTVMLNGKLTYLTAAQLATLLRSTDGTTIKSIEIITNPSAKYDAAGNSGIINIILKKNKQTGTNGSLTAGAGYGAYGKDNENLTLNHKEGKLNVFGTFSHNDNKRIQNIGVKRIIPDTAGSAPTYFNQASPLLEADHNNSYRIGADYDLSTKNTIGFVASGYFNGEQDNIDDHTYIGKSFNQVDSSLRTVSGIHQTFHNIAFNLNDSWKIDTAGQELSADLDYSQFKNNSVAQYVTDYYLANGGTQQPQWFLGNHTPSTINIRTGKIDYVKPITKTLKFESGLKFSDVKTDNDLMEKDAPGNPYLSTNHFVYDEKIDAGYINFNKDFKGYSVQAGLRAEYTSSNAHGDSANVVSVIPRHYLDFFPSLFISHDFNDKNGITFSYSRRIDRPQYDNLNPFIFRLDPYTYQLGNPYLRPQYTNNYELNYTYNKSITLTLGYSKTTDVITEVPGTDPATKVSFITQENLQVQNAWNANLYAPYTIAKWWEGNVNATAFYLGFKSNNLEGGNLDRGQFAYNIRTTQTFIPIATYKAELTANYQSDLTYGLYDVKPRYSVDAGVSHSFANKKLNVKLSMSDIFNTLRNDVNSQYQNTDLYITQKRESRVTRLTLTWNFGNNKIKARQHQTGADDEKNRVKGNN